MNHVIFNIHVFMISPPLHTHTDKNEENKFFFFQGPKAVGKKEEKAN